MNQTIPEENLLLYDIKNFLEKYTRFMTKNIYISTKMHTRFLNQYHYLYNVLEKEQLLYSGNLEYQQALNFYKNQHKFLRLHNIKYLKEANSKHQNFFLQLYPKEILDANKQNAILSTEEQLTFVNNKNTIPFIVSKIKYLVEVQHYKESKIIIILPTEEWETPFREELLHKNLSQIQILTLADLKEKVLTKEEKELDKKLQYQIIKDCIIQEWFPNKKEFSQFYQAFGNYIYLNKDYKEFDTFRDYHHYLYKRKYLSTGLSLKKYNEEEIKKRRNQLRTICNEVTNSKTEVDIANFLYINQIPYHYQKTSATFLLYPGEKNIPMKYQKELPSTFKYSSDFILYEQNQFGKKALETLAYECINRRYPMERRKEEEVYDQLKNTAIDSYFSEFITKCVLAWFQQYQITKNSHRTNMTKEQINILMKMTSYLEEQIKKNHWITETTLYERMAQEIDSQQLDYVVLVQEEKLNLKTNYLRVLEQYKEISFIKENIKFSQEYKKYINENKQLPVPNCFLDLQEMKILCQAFLKKNLKEINQTLAVNPKPVIVYFYDDQSRFKIPKEIAELTNLLIQKKPQESILIGLNHRNEINPLISFSDLEKLEKNKLISPKKQVIDYEELKATKQSYSIILLPYLLSDKYQENLLDQYYEHNLKMNLLAALSKSKKEVWLLCPISKKEKISQTLKGLQNVKIEKTMYK